MRILVLDNYDSFTYNLVQVLRSLSLDITLRRNDKITLEEAADFDVFILSPGPGIPEEAGILKALISTYAHKKKILGVCLGHQALAEVFGARLKNIHPVYHGVATTMRVTQVDTLFEGLGMTFDAGRYHSWVVDKASLPDCLEVLAEDALGEIMALKHRTYSCYGLQFHPESILTPKGAQLIRNFIHYVKNVEVV